ncbi:MAG: hypothetical protein HQ402_01210 [Parcubacteria group bacterium]|nr:hypothetical protein [Parcubacteria group bacterium]
MHGQTGWDDTPYWVMHAAYVVCIEVVGFTKWGPFTYHHPRARRKHARVSLVKISKGFLYRDSSKEVDAPEENLSGIRELAEDKALRCAEIFEDRGIPVRFKFGSDFSSKNLEKRVDWMTEPPPRWCFDRASKEILFENLSSSQ